jgi:penicillin-binding protein 1A
VAGKTGTTNNYRDALFVGFSPAIAAGVWVGLDLGGTLEDRETGAKAALPIWIQFMENVPTAGSRPYFDLPDNVVKVRINPQTGRLAADGSQNAVYAMFIKGTEPKK